MNSRHIFTTISQAVGRNHLATQPLAVNCQSRSPGSAASCGEWKVESNLFRSVDIDPIERLQKFPFILGGILGCSVCAFACWTLACQVAVALHLSFFVLCLVGPVALASGVIAAFVLLRASRQNFIPAPAGVSVESEEVLYPWVAIAAALVSGLALGMGYPVFWIGAVALLSAALLRQGQSLITCDDVARPLTRSGKTFLILLIVAAPAVTYLAHAPNIDDAVYVGTAADAVAHPELPVLSHDVLYGNDKFPLMLPSYSVESYELLIAFFARAVHVEPIFLAHAIFPTALAILVVIAWAGLMRMLAAQHWLSATGLALIGLNLPGPPRGFGCFAFTGLFVGKSLLVSIGIPALFTYAWKYEESGSIYEWLVLVAATIACVGVSASAIFVAPMALTIAAIAGARRGHSSRALLALSPALYPLGCGLLVSRGFGSLEHIFANLPARVPLAISSVFGAHTQYLLLFAVLVAPFFVPGGASRRRILIVVVIYFLAALDPFTFKFLSRFTTRDAVWRVLWCVPVAGLFATAAIGGVQALTYRCGKKIALGAILLGSASVAYLFRYSMLADASYSLNPLKVEATDYIVAREAIDATPPNSVLLVPEGVAVWVPTFVHRMPLVSVRALYDDEMGAHLSPPDSKTRRELRELASGAGLAHGQLQRLRDALAEYSVGLIVTPGSAADHLAPLLASGGYSRLKSSHGYVFFRRELLQSTSP